MAAVFVEEGSGRAGRDVLCFPCELTLVFGMSKFPLKVMNRAAMQNKLVSVNCKTISRTRVSCCCKPQVGYCGGHCRGSRKAKCTARRRALFSIECTGAEKSIGKHQSDTTNT